MLPGLPVFVTASCQRVWRLFGICMQRPGQPGAKGGPRLCHCPNAEFYRAGDSLQYGGAGKVSEAGIDRMVAELNER
jgi:hypothetical protein